MCMFVSGSGDYFYYYHCVYFLLVTIHVFMFLTGLVNYLFILDIPIRVIY